MWSSHGTVALQNYSIICLSFIFSFPIQFIEASSSKGLLLNVYFYLLEVIMDCHLVDVSRARVACVFDCWFFEQGWTKLLMKADFWPNPNDHLHWSGTAWPTGGIRQTMISAFISSICWNCRTSACRAVDRDSDSVRCYPSKSIHHLTYHLVGSDHHGRSRLVCCTFVHCCPVLFCISAELWHNLM